MASIATHYIFAEKVYQSSDTNIQKVIKQAPSAYTLGAQGPDIFFYDCIQLGLTIGGRNIGSRMHTTRTDTFFMNYLLKAKQMQVLDNPVIVSYYYGLLAHYCLDYNIHPYIYAKSTCPEGTKNAGNVSTSTHCQLESYIDELLYYKTYGHLIKTFRRKNFMNISRKDTVLIAKVLSSAINATYGYHISSNYIKGTISRAVFFNSALNDSLGIKKKLIAPIEKMLFGAPIGSSLIFTTKLPDSTCLNEDHTIWRYPVTKKLTTKSVPELFLTGKKDALKLFHYCSNTVSALNVTKEPSQILCIAKSFAAQTKGLSYHTGLNWRWNED
jgi:hypothetical protein